MSFYEDWREKQAQKFTDLWALIEQSRCWIGCRVCIAPDFFRSESMYGEVESISEDGGVKIVVDSDQQGQPRYYGVQVSHLGNVVTLAEP